MATGARDPALHQARVQFMSSHVITSPLRAEIATSWQRSVSAGLQPDKVVPAYEADLDFEGRLATAAGPVASRLSEDLTDTGVSLFVSDGQGRLLTRYVTDLSQRAVLDRDQLAPGFGVGEEIIGTNGVGTALQRAEPISVLGEEHFADALAALACTAAPVTDPGTGEVLGSICLTCPADLAHPIMLPVVKRAGREIEERLLAMTSARNPALRSSFFRARQQVAGPLAAVSQHGMQTNPPAARFVRPADQPVLWDWIAAVIAGRRSPDSDLELSDGLLVTAHAWPIYDGGMLAGALVRFDQPASQQPAAGTAALGWDSLTETERSVAVVISEGKTNREAAARLYLSPHTVDYYLRQIFRKLGIGSRVELARLVLTRTGPHSGAGLAVAGALPIADSRSDGNHHLHAPHRQPRHGAGHHRAVRRVRRRCVGRRRRPAARLRPARDGGGGAAGTRRGQ